MKHSHLLCARKKDVINEPLVTFVTSTIRSASARAHKKKNKLGLKDGLQERNKKKKTKRKT